MSPPFRIPKASNHHRWLKSKQSIPSHFRIFLLLLCLSFPFQSSHQWRHFFRLVPITNSFSSPSILVQAALSIPDYLGACDLVQIHDDDGDGIVSWGLEVYFQGRNGGSRESSPAEIIPCYGPDCFWRVDVPQDSNVLFCSNLTSECSSTASSIRPASSTAPSSWGGSSWCLAQNTGAVTLAIQSEASVVSSQSATRSSPTSSSLSSGVETSSPTGPLSSTPLTDSANVSSQSASLTSTQSSNSSSSPTAGADGDDTGGGRNHMGSIVGGTVGGLAGVALLGSLFFFFISAQRRRETVGERDSNRKSSGRGSGSSRSRSGGGIGNARAYSEMAESSRCGTPDALGRSWKPGQPDPNPPTLQWPNMDVEEQGEHPIVYGSPPASSRLTTTPPNARLYPWTKYLPTWENSGSGGGFGNGGSGLIGGSDPFRRSWKRVSSLASRDLNPIAEEGRLPGVGGTSDEGGTAVTGR